MLERYRKPPEPMPLGEIVDDISAEIWRHAMAPDSRFAPSEEEPLLCGNKELTQVYAIWKSKDIPRSVRQRAVATLTAPVGQQLPFDAPELQHNRGVLNLSPGDNVGFTEVFDAQVFLQDIEKKHINELAKGVLFWLDQNERNNRQGTSPYDGPILQLIPYVDEAIADRLFAYYTLPEPDAFHSGGWVTYRNIEALCIDAGIPEKYKLQALEGWFAAVKREYYHPYGEATRRLVDLLRTDHVDEGVDLGPKVRSRILIFLGAFGPPSDTGHSDR